MKSEIVQVEVDEHGDLLVPIPKEMLEELGWTEGQEVDMEWVDGKIIVTKVSSEKNK
jgi:bifunctional DNA-binding transcriptional regulator/antitoxin component of YhaV-PrlF toxin-antitoxin module